MPRRARLVLPDVPLHIIQRGNNRQQCFFADADYLAYLDWLEELAGRSECRVHAYVLMSNHIHLLLSASNVAAPGALMKMLGQYFTHHVNRRYQRTGTLWEGRYKSCLVQEDGYLMQCQRYIELNPVRAHLVSDPARYRWSSYRGNAEGHGDPILTPHPLYLGLASDAGQRRQAYRALFGSPSKQKRIDDLRLATNSDFAWGDQAFMTRAAAVRKQGQTLGSDPM
ncbi:transposase [Rugamonas rubra]|uniref:Putative transposase n=1 Tax=Rugamonas rubra TaxID=758825 RepID=A0A1I4JEJ1_9BURK|nr:transposase [Rugamonas rubra]SFL64998.1 putative transposase [Rugamonas rubra]